MSIIALAQFPSLLNLADARDICCFFVAGIVFAG